MEKVRLFLNWVNISMVGFIALVTRIVIKGAGIGEALALLAVAALYGYGKYLENNTQPDVNEELYKEIQNLKDSINLVKLTKGLKQRDTTNFKF